jgi:hypothetical protein
LLPSDLRGKLEKNMSGCGLINVVGRRDIPQIQLGSSAMEFDGAQFA